MDPFSTFFTNHRHRRAIPGAGDPRYTRKHQNIVPDYVKTDPTKNPKIELIRQKRGKQICDTNTLNYIRKEYNVIPYKGKTKKYEEGEPKELGDKKAHLQSKKNKVALSQGQDFIQ